MTGKFFVKAIVLVLLGFPLCGCDDDARDPMTPATPATDTDAEPITDTPPAADDVPGTAPTPDVESVENEDVHEIE